MSVILRNEHGAIAVNKGVIERMIIEDLLELSDSLILCNKKGKPIKDKGQRFLDPDYFDAIEIYEKRQEVRVKVYMISVFGSAISNVADEVFARIEKDFELLKLKLPGTITVHVRGIMMSSELIVRRNIEIVRNNA